MSEGYRVLDEAVAAAVMTETERTAHEGGGFNHPNSIPLRGLRAALVKKLGGRPLLNETETPSLPPATPEE
jgi:hypothetical protein